jgi:myo-inositol-1-phosphate synthase
MSHKQFGIWFIGPYGGVATTTALGLACLKRGLVSGTGLVTDLDLFRNLKLPAFDRFVVGGHDVRQAGFLESARELAAKSGVFDDKLLRACHAQFAEWDANVCPGTVRGAGKTVAKLSTWDGTGANLSGAETIERLAADIEKFQARHQLAHVVVINLASTAPLVIDLARLATLEWSRGGHGLMPHLACFFKRPMGVETQNLFEQWRMLQDYVEGVQGSEFSVQDKRVEKTRK